MYVEKDLNTGKEIIKDINDKRIYNPSNKILASAYKLNQIDAQLWIYGCRKCGWTSKTFVP